MAETAQREVEFAPRLSARAPSHLHHLLSGLDEAVKLDAPGTALRLLREALAFLLGYFTDLLEGAANHSGAGLPAPEASETRDLAATENRLRDAIKHLSTRADDPLVRSLLVIFFDLESQTPREFYLLTQGAKVGKLGRLSDFCKEPKKPPGRNDAVKLRAQYMPHLAAWLEVAQPLWEGASPIWERTSLEGQLEVLTEFSGLPLKAGPRCDLNGCPACIPSRNLIIPASVAGSDYQVGVPQGVPEHTLHLTDRLSRALDAQEAAEATRLLRDTLEFLLRYFAGVATILCGQLDVLPRQAQRYTENFQLVENCERLLHLCVEALKEQPDDSSAKLVVGVFYRRNELFEFLPRAHTGVLLLEGVLSNWFKTERGGVRATEEKSRADFERYFPLLRDWLGAMGPYFSQTEHYEEPPTKDGKLPLTLRLGERLLELVEPGYILRIRQCPVCLPDPVWLTQPQPPPPLEAAPEAEAAPVVPGAGAVEPGPSPPSQDEALVDVATAASPVPAPPVPRASLEALIPISQRVVQGEFRLIQIPERCPRFLERVLKRLELHMRRDEMTPTWAAMRDALEYMIRYWAGVAALGAKALGCLPPQAATLAESSMSVDQCEKLLILSLRALLNKSEEDLSQEIRVVFFSREQFSEHDRPTGAHARMIQMDADPDNKMQLLSDFCSREPETDQHKCRREVKSFLPVLSDWLRMSGRFYEQCEHYEEPPDQVGKMELVVQFDLTYLELVAPDYVFYVKPGADQVPDLEVPQYVEPEDAILVSVPEAPKERVLSEEELALQQPFLMHRVAFVGYQKNTHGANCKSGVIKVTNAGGGTLTGTAFSTHPCIEVSPRRFKDGSQLIYWLDEAEVPRDYSPVIILRSGTDERQVSLNELRPMGRLSTIKEGQAKLLLALPTLVSLILFSLLLLVVSTDIAHTLAKLPPAGKLSQVAPAELDQMLGKGNWVGWFYLCIPILAPGLSLLLYKGLPPTMQDLVLPYLQQVMGLPSGLMLLLLLLPVFRVKATSHPELYNMNLLHLLPWFLFFNACTAVYINVSLSGKLAELIEEPAFRNAVPVVLFGIWVMMATLALL